MLKLLKNTFIDLKSLLTLGLCFSACSTFPMTESSQVVDTSKFVCSKESILNNKGFEERIFAYIFNDRFTFIALECGEDHIFFNEEESDPRSLQLLRNAVNNEHLGFSGEIIIRPTSLPIDQFGNLWVTLEVVGPLIVESSFDYYAKAEKRLPSTPDESPNP